MAYVRIGRWEHTDLQGTAWKLDLFEDGGSLSTDEYKMTGPMFTLTYEGDLFKEGRLELEWLIENSTQYTKAAGFVEGQITTYLIQLNKGGSLYWQGFLDPRLIELTEGDYPRRTKLTFKDGATLAANFPRDTNQNTGNYDRLIEIIAECLPFSVDIKTYTNWTHTSLSAGDWVYQTYVDRYVFRETQRRGEVDEDTDMTYREVLENLLFTSDLTCIQSDGEWHLMQRDNLDNATYTRYNYTSSGAQDSPVSDSSVNLDLSIDSTNSWMLPSSSAFWQGGLRQNAYTYAHDSQSYGIRFFPTGYRIANGASDLEFEQVFATDGEDKINFFANVTCEIEKEFEAVKTDASVNIELRVGSASVGYVYWDGSTWSTTQGNIKNLLITGRARGGIDSDIVTRFTGTVDFTTSEIPEQYDGTIKLTLKKATKTSETVTYTLYQDLNFAIVGPDNEDNSTDLIYSLTTDRSVQQVDRYGKVKIGEGPSGWTRGAFRYLSGISYPILSPGFFNRVGVSENRNHGFMVLRSRMDFFRRSRKTIRAEVYGEYEAHKILSYDSKRFVFDRGVFVGREGRWRTAYFIEINPESASSLSATDTFDIAEDGIIPQSLTPVTLEPNIGIPFVDPFDSDVNEADLLTTGAGAPTTRSDNTELKGGEIVYNTQSGDTTPYRFVNLPTYQNLYDFRTSADGFTATNATVTFGEQAATIGERGSGRGLLEVTCTATGSGTVSIQDSSPTHDGFMRAQVFIPSTNTTLLGVRPTIGGSSGTEITTTDAWTDISIGGFVSGGSVGFRGTDGAGNNTFTRTNGDIFLIRDVDAFGNVVSVSAGTVTNYDPQSISSTYRVNVDILLVRSISDDSIENWGYITSKTSVGGHVDEVANTAAPTASGYFVIYGVWRGAFTSIKGDYITTGTLDASLVNVTNLNASNITSGSIDASTITVSNLDADNITSGTLAAARIDVTDLFSQTITISSPGYIQSTGYSAGTAGFKIEAGGDAEFNNITARGVIIPGVGSDINGTYITVNTITASQIAAGTITATEIAANTITASEIAASTITATEIASGTITADKIDVGDLFAEQIEITGTGYIQSDVYTAGSAGFRINADGSAEFNDVTVRGILEAAAGSAIDGSYITAGTITGDKMDIVALSALSTDTGALTVSGDLTLSATSEIKITNSISIKEIPGAQVGAQILGSTGSIYFDSQAVLIGGVGGTFPTTYGVKTDESGLVTISSGSGVNVAFFGGGGGAKQTVTGSRGGNAALASLLTALANYGLITDSST